MIKGNLSKRNVAILLIISVLLVYKLYLASQNFPDSFINGLQRTVIFFISILLILKLILRLKYRWLLVLGYVVLTLALSFLNLWKVATNNYLQKHDTAFTNITSNLANDTSTFSIGLHGDSIAYRWTEKSFSPAKSKSFKEALHALNKTTEVIEIEKDKYITLFVLSRFIDNGYGIAYIKNESLKELYTLKHYRLNGYDITGLVHVKDNWYYISFT